jgi:leukotriene-A4 hydrolase
MARMDPHSYFDPEQPLTKELCFFWEVDFASKRIAGRVHLLFGKPAQGPLDLDSKGLVLHGASTSDGREVRWEAADPEPVLGQRLRFILPEGTSELVIHYETSPSAVALQWLEPAQTEGKVHPFLFSQCQSIHARTLAPLQDSPRVRTPYRAEVTIPAELTAVMSAGSAGSRPGERPGTKTFLFEMPQPIPSYLLALAVGNLASRDLSPRSRVWAEPETVEAAAWEFAGIEDMILAAEGIFGPYEWDRYDMLVLPPSFPYGGMENPRLTFLTPTLLAGDRSLVAVVAHELAHSWTGNLVTNATNNDFWLNEGFTVWAERRILEALRGEDYAALAWAMGLNDLMEAFGRFGAGSPLTQLRTNLEGVDPDSAFSEIPYEKGARFVRLLEETVGRPRFDEFIRAYMARFRFTSITTKEFLDFLVEQLPGAAERVGASQWVDGPGLPENAPAFRSERLELIQGLSAGWSQGILPSAEQAQAWTPQETVLYLQGLPREIPHDQCRRLDGHFSLTGRTNYEILVEWLTIAAASGYEPAFPRIREVLTGVGRMKYLRPLYGALGRHPRTRELALKLYAEARPGYHSLSRQVVEGILATYPKE